jgi:hypothetical protein
MAVQQVDRPRRGQEAARGRAETGKGEKTGRFRLSETYWRMHREDRGLFYRMIRHICRIVKMRTINLSYQKRKKYMESGYSRGGGDVTAAVTGVKKGDEEKVILISYIWYAPGARGLPSSCIRSNHCLVRAVRGAGREDQEYT